MDTERDVARGIQRQKTAEARANLASGFGCFGVAVAVIIVLALVGINPFIGTFVGLFVGLVVMVLIYRRVLIRNLNR